MWTSIIVHAYIYTRLNKLDLEAKKLVEERYFEDIKRFGYTFGEPSPKNLIKPIN
jgi:hypothetical protein